MKYLMIIPAMLIVGCTQSVDLAPNPAATIPASLKQIPQPVSEIPKGVNALDLLKIAAERGRSHNACVRQIGDLIEAYDRRDAIQFNQKPDHT